MDNKFPPLNLVSSQNGEWFLFYHLDFDCYVVFTALVSFGKTAGVMMTFRSFLACNFSELARLISSCGQVNISQRAILKAEGLSGTGMKDIAKVVETPTLRKSI